MSRVQFVRQMLPKIAASPVLHLTATTTGASETVSLARLTVNSQTTISWGDGASETLSINSTSAVPHVYAVAGTYNIAVSRARNVTQLQFDSAKIGGLNTAELRYSPITYFYATLITNSTVKSADMVNWRPTDWRLYSMPAGTYSISSADMVDWRPTDWRLYLMPAGTYSISSADMVNWRPRDWRLYSMPSAGSSYAFAASCMRNWTSLATLTINDLGLDATTVDAVLADLYAGRMGYTAAAPTAIMDGTNANPSGVYQAQVPPTTGMECKYELLNDSTSQGFHLWAITT